MRNGCGRTTTLFPSRLVDANMFPSLASLLPRNRPNRLTSDGRLARTTVPQGAASQNAGPPCTDRPPWLRQLPWVSERWCDRRVVQQVWVGLEAERTCLSGPCVTGTSLAHGHTWGCRRVARCTPRPPWSAVLGTSPRPTTSEDAVSYFDELSFRAAVLLLPACPGRSCARARPTAHRYGPPRPGRLARPP